MSRIGKYMGYLYIFGCIAFTVYGQLIIKWRMGMKGQLPSGFENVAKYFVKVFSDPFVISGFLAALVASMFWMAALTKFDLSFAYPLAQSLKTLHV